MAIEKIATKMNIVEGFGVPEIKVKNLTMFVQPYSREIKKKKSNLVLIFNS